MPKPRTLTDEQRKANQAAATARWRERNPEKVKALEERHRATKSKRAKDKYVVALREKNLRKNYGITIEDKRLMWEAQRRRCTICGLCMPLFGDKKDGPAHVDHCHETGKVRSLLCPRCNVGLGAFLDCPDTLEAAAQYLRAHGRD